MKKKPYEGFGSFLARMTLNYRYGNSKDETKLTEDDKRQIKNAFIESLDYPLRGHLKHDDNLGFVTYANLATRASQAQRAYQPAKAEEMNHVRSGTINAISSTETQNNDLKAFMTEQTKMMRQLIELVSAQNTIRSVDSYDKKRPNSKPFDRNAWRERVSKQICREFKENGECRFGSRCYRLHEKN